MRKFLIVMFLPIALAAQTKMLIKDSTTGRPIPFVAIHFNTLDSNNVRASTVRASNGNGEFELPGKHFDSLTLSTPSHKKIKIAKTEMTYPLYLHPLPRAAQQGVAGLKKQKHSKSAKLNAVMLKGKHMSTMHVEPSITAKYFAYQKKYEQTPYLNKIFVNMVSYIPNAIYRVRIYEPQADGTPGDDVVTDNIIRTAAHGLARNEVDLSMYRIPFSRKGIFIGIEVLGLNENRATVPLHIKGETRDDFYQPSVLTDEVARGTMWVNYFDNWNDQRIGEKGIYNNHVWRSTNNLLMEIELSD